MIRTTTVTTMVTIAKIAAGTIVTGMVNATMAPTTTHKTLKNLLSATLPLMTHTLAMTTTGSGMIATSTVLTAKIRSGLIVTGMTTIVT